MTGVHATTDQLSRIEDAMRSLQESFRGPLLRPGDAEYDEARTVWNAMIDRKPAIIAQCTSSGDVSAVVNAAREHELLLSIHGGGHNVAGNAVCDGGLMIDLSLMRGIEVDSDARIVRAEGGVLWGEFDAATQAHGLATTGGTVSTTGIAGLTLGGGIGLLGRRFGLACDNLLSVEVVTADGQPRTASETEHADLFWAIRGGGGNFGVVTSFTYRLHPVGPTVIGGLLIHPLERAREMFRFYRDWIPSAPEELTVLPGMLTGPDGNRLAVFIVCYSGPLEEGERVLAPLRAFGPPVADLIAETPYLSVQQLFDPGYPSGRRNYWKSSFADELSDGAIDTLVSHFERVPSPLTALAYEHLGGAIDRVETEATAFSQRGAAFNLLITSGWENPADDEVNIRWTRDLWEAMQPFSRAAAYVNYLSEGEQDRVRAAYGEKYDRMVALKTTYDPTNLFRMNQNIKPAQG
jgi:FAD/FMN-containing dehydrogenase